MTETVMALCPLVWAQRLDPFQGGNERPGATGVQGAGEAGDSLVLASVKQQQTDRTCSSPVQGVQVWIEGKEESRDQLVAPGLISLIVMIKP